MSKKSTKQSILNRVFNKSKPMSAQIPEQAPKMPRSKDQINTEYQQLCTTLGDKVVKKEGLDLEIKALFKHVESLGNELTARESIDTKAAQEAMDKATAEAGQSNQTSANLIDTDTLAPQTNGVDA